VELREHVVLPDGMFARLLPISANIERGFTLESGKVDAGYGNLLGQRQSVMMGLRNNLNAPSLLDASKGIAQLEITDLRGAEARFGGFSDESIESFAERSARFIRARDDGVFYE
jgi:deoxycytidine triphosphate deaminase